MGLSNFFKKLFSTKTCDNHPCTKPINGVVVANGDSSHYPDEYKRVLVFNLAVNTLLSNDMYIARSDYRDIIAEYEDLPEFYGALIKSGLLIEYICKHNLDANEITLFLCLQSATEQTAFYDLVFTTGHKQPKLKKLLVELVIRRQVVCLIKRKNFSA